ncbi:hypothetical protein OSTOST_14441, partial [Ostertagia ostertagi]
SFRDEPVLLTKSNERIPSSPETSGRSDLLVDNFLHEDLNRDVESSKDQFDRNNVIDKSRCKRTNFQSTDREDLDKDSRQFEDLTQHPLSVTANVESARQRELAIRSEDEEDVQMTKLDKLAVRVVKRVAESNELSTDEGQSFTIVDQLQETNVETTAERRNLYDEPTTEGNVSREQQESASDGTESSGHSGSETCVPVPAPTENVWAKRQEERESQEKE